MLLSVTIISLLGVAVSLYSYLLERTLAKNPAYKPMCDLSDRISCSAPLKSPYATMLGVSNAVWALLYYTSIILMALKDYVTPLLALTTAGIVYSAYLAYILVSKIRAWCLVCTCMYLINLVLWVLSILLYLYQ